jgi:pimeloyl-ACP methyl ester carboxylesterase
MPHALVNGCDTSYEVAGNGPPLLFMHGGMGGLGTGGLPSEPQPWHEELSKHYTVITYDRRSSGRSCMPETPHTLELFADDAYELLRHLGIERAVVWGESAGVAIAITFAMRHSDATTALVLTDGAPWFSRDPELVRRLEQRIGILETEGPEAAYEARRAEGTVGLNAFAPGHGETGDRSARGDGRERIRAQLVAVGRPERIRMYAAELRTYAAYVGFDVTGTFARLSMPILVVYGTGDRVFPGADWAEVTDGMDNVEYVALEGADHGSGRRPDAIRAVASFLARVTR